jgi:hypothetical protein
MTFKSATFTRTERYKLLIYLLHVIMLDVILLNDVAPGRSLPMWSIPMCSTVNGVIFAILHFLHSLQMGPTS